MFNSVFLDVAIGMIFIFLLYSILVTAIQELIATIFKLRSRYLFSALFHMFKDRNFGDQLAQDFQNHPLIKKITFTGRQLVPSYISQETFVRVVKDLLPDVHLGPNRSLSVLEKINLLPEGEIKKTLFTYLSDQTKTVDQLLGVWFEATMERLSGTYKRMTQYVVLITGFIVAMLFNVDAFSIFTNLSTNQKFRQNVLEQAQAFAEVNKDYDSMMNRFRSRVAADTSRAGRIRLDSLDDARANDSVLAEFNRQRQEIKKFIDNDLKNVNNASGIGWDTIEGNTLGDKIAFLSTNWYDIPKKLAGWLITAVAITIGAPFWFDLLQKLVRIRGTGPQKK
ncbi:MAG TPA: hypothetical protein VD993_00615 [Chitinophagaceae bacterium]|nr:hypothetical protein [Chitinophagaceae bacterium]